MRLIFLLLVCLPAWGVTKTVPNLNKILTRFQKAWDSDKTFEADFNQKATSKAMGTEDDSQGHLYIEKPGHIRWESQTDHSIQILNGKKFWNIQDNPRRHTRTVDVYEDVSRQIDTKTLDFLAGKTPFREVYRVKAANFDPFVIAIKLVPKKGGDQTYIATLDGKSYLLRALDSDTAESSTHISFSNIKTNVKLANSLFEYQPGPNDIVHKQ